MKINSHCLTCLVQMQESRVTAFDDEEKKCCYMREVLSFLGACNPELSAPVLLAYLSETYEKYWGKVSGDSEVEQIKKEFNDYLLSMEAELEKDIRCQENPLRAALTYARTGNYIDYASVKDLTKKKFKAFLDEQTKNYLDQEEYVQFLEELNRASRLVYLTDNCGEIVLDKIVLKILKEQYPELKITVIVRGKPVVNDADIDAAKYVGLDKIVTVMGNGSAIAGTDLSDVSQDAAEQIHAADLIIAKGQGNFETLHGCGLNIYYLFLCKCDWFMKKFEARRFQGMFINERRIGF